MRTQPRHSDRAEAVAVRSTFTGSEWAWSALDHIAADEGHGRAWSCNCGSCVAARKALAEVRP